MSEVKLDVLEQNRWCARSDCDVVLGEGADKT